MAASAPARNGERKPPAIRTSPNAMKDTLLQARDRLEAVLPRHLTPERMATLVSTMMFRTPKLQECDSGSILAAVVQASSLGLELLPSLCEAFLIPRWNSQAKCMECQFQPGYQGLRKLAMNSGKLALLEARIVRQDDEFAVDYDPDLRFLHRPALGSDAPIVAVYSFAKLANGERSVEVMTTDQVEEIHRRGEGYRNAIKYGEPEKGPWVTDWSEMARKTVLKRHTKSLPRSVELAEAIYADDAEYRDRPAIDARAIPEGATASARLAATLKRQSLPAPEDEVQAPPVEPEDVSQDSDAAPWEDDGQAIDG